MKIIIALCAAITLGACVGRNADQELQEVIRDAKDAVRSGRAEMIAVSAPLQDESGRVRARSEVLDDPDGGGLIFRIAARNLSQGTYAVHVHAVGRCDPPDFTSAGAHWNPTNVSHGRDNPAGPHLGDLPNLVVANDGRGSVEFKIAGAALKGGAMPLYDADGSALVIHAAADDYRTDPSGNSGARIACGVLTR